jgi:hypothetical protein
MFIVLFRELIMKHVSTLAACAIGLAFAASPAWAQDMATIYQEAGSGNTASIEQIGSLGGNTAVVQQGAGWGGGGNSTQVLQQGVEGSRVEVHQGGSMNQYTVTQLDGRNLEATVNMNAAWWGDSGGHSNFVLIEQSGFDSRATVEQGDSMNSQAEIRQMGWGGQNVADIVSYGENNRASIQQAGGNQLASIQQMGGFGNVATIRQNR